MKTIKINKTISGCLIISVLVFFGQSCTTNFEEINTDPFNISDEQLEIDFNNVGAPFVQAQQFIYAYDPPWQFQLQQNLNGDVYSGYMMPPTPFAGNSNNMTYNLVDGWNLWPWNIAYLNIMGPLQKSDKAGGEDFQEFKAWAKIIRVQAMHRLSDQFGPIIYSQFGEIPSLYDCQENVYSAFFADLESAITELTPRINDETRPFTAFDFVYGGDYEKWVQFANSLRLRLAIRISRVDPSLAQEQGEAALSHSVGLLEENDQNFVIASSSGASHPLNTINNAWNDIRMGAEMESILEGYTDPRLDAYFEPASDPLFKGEYQGIRQGIAIASKSNYETYSKLTLSFGDVQLMTAAEVYFLRAEAALRGWAGAGGTAKALYETGVQISFDQHGKGDATSYLADNTSTANPYIDPKNAENNVAIGSPDLSTSTIQYNDADPMETNLERIITQKWIAMYPDGQEAWSEYRRTGYPKLFPVVVNLSGGKIPDVIKRINFTSSEVLTNQEGVTSGKECPEIGGVDNGGTSLWWDVD